MEHQIKHLSKSEVEVTVTLDQAEMEKYRQMALEDLGKNVKIKGFRPGHVPKNVIEQQIGEEAIRFRTQDIALQKTYPQIIVKENIQVVASPKVKIETEDPLKYVATVAVLPEIELKDYKSIKVKKEAVKVEEKDVQEVVDDMLRYVTTWKDVERAAKEGDRAELDFEGFEKDKPVEGTKSSNHPVVLGQKTLIPGFEENVVGMKVGEEKEFDITFPKDYHSKDFQGRKLTFKIKLQRLEESEIPELNEDTIEKLSGKKESPEAFKKDIEKNLKLRKEMEARQKQENEYLEELLKKVEVELPKALIDEEVHYIIADMKADIESKGMKWEQFMEQTKMSHEDLHKKYEVEAEKRIKIRMALQKMIQDEKIEVTDADVADVKDEGKKIQAKNRLALERLFDKVLG